MARNPSNNPEIRHVGLVLQTGQSLMRGITRGVYRYLRVNRHWRILGDGQYPLLHWDQLGGWRGDGLIAIPNSEQQLETLLGVGVPVVNVGSRIIDPRFATVACDSQAIGKIAAEHLMESGLKNFLFLSELRWENEQLRYQAFDAAVRDCGLRCAPLRLEVHETIADDASGHYKPDLDLIAEALDAAQKPVGVCAPNSGLARLVVEVALECGFHVPDDVAVLGVNDDPLICESTVPHLSAVVQPAEKIGYRAAVRLDALMSGSALNTTPEFLLPVGVAGRESTNLLAVADDDIRSALRFIREHAQDPIEVAEIAEHVAISRRTLETKFRATLGRTPALELRRVRIELAKKLLAETSDPITNIVFAAGFNSRQVFSSLFRRVTGMTPSEYRRNHRIDVLEPPLLDE
ncbi:MAG: substrate-binding domain-containing protein [Planctomycetales bacterium]|nr:substrate-binding domain-containing protein [Planctomycetales bacterium]